MPKSNSTLYEIHDRLTVSPSLKRDSIKNSELLRAVCLFSEFCLSVANFLKSTKALLRRQVVKQWNDKRKSCHPREQLEMETNAKPHFANPTPATPVGKLYLFYFNFERMFDHANNTTNNHIK